MTQEQKLFYAEVEKWIKSYMEDKNTNDLNEISAQFFRTAIQRYAGRQKYLQQKGEKWEFIDYCWGYFGENFDKFIGRRQEYDDFKGYRNYIYECIRRCFIDWLRKREKRLRNLKLISDITENEQDEQYFWETNLNSETNNFVFQCNNSPKNPLQQLILEEEEMVFWRAVYDKLKKDKNIKRRYAIFLMLQNYSNNEIMVLLDVSRSQCKTWFRRFKEDLVSSISKRDLQIA